MKILPWLLLCLPLPLFCQQPGQPADLWKDKRAQNDLANFLDAKLTTGYNIESELTFPFSKGKFPELELASPATVRSFLGGDYSIKVRWFDADLREVEKPGNPGRYAYYAEIAGVNGILMRRSATLFCAPNDWQGWPEEIRADLQFFPLHFVPRKVWEENQDPISRYAGKIILKSILDNQEGGILLAFLHELHRQNLKPGPFHTPVILDGDYHARLKQKILGVEKKYRELALPQRSGIDAPVLRQLPQKDKVKNALFEKQMTDLCHEWAEVGGEPFEMLVAKEGAILFHGAFGENLRGKMSIGEPVEIASITKLYTGLLFAQFVEQDLIHIDDCVGAFLPDFATAGEQAITLRQCFTHTAGFIGHGSLGGVQNPWLDNSLALWLPYLSMGTEHVYNGMGYNLAGKVMEIVSGKSIFHLMQEYLFSPLELKHTSLDIDLAYGTKATAYDMAVIGQLLLNQGKYGNLQFFSEKTYHALLPVKLENYYPKIKDKEWGIGIIPMTSHVVDQKAGTKRALLSGKLIGHGSATSSIFRVDPENKIVITQSRLDGGKSYEEYLSKALLLIEKQCAHKWQGPPSLATSETGY